MIRHALMRALALVAVLSAPVAPALAKSPPSTWDDLVLVNSKRFHLVYMLPTADFRPYSKVLIEPTEAAFQKDWIRDYNRTKVGLEGRVSNSDAEKAIQKISTGFKDVLAKACTAAGYQVVTTPGPDVLTLRSGIVNIKVNAPDLARAGRVRMYAEEAGDATYFVEARDSSTHALLGRVVDRQLAGNNSTLLRNAVTNKSDFNKLFKDWAAKTVAGLNELKTRAPVQASASAR